MSAIKDALGAIREAVKPVDEVKMSAARINALADEMRELDRRLSRLEGKWEAAVDLGRASTTRSIPRLPGRGDKDDPGNY